MINKGIYIARKRKQWFSSNWTVLTLFVLLSIVLFSTILVFKRTTFFTNLDNVDQFYTWYQKLATSLHHGYLPIWNANQFSGQSFAGEFQPGVFYPLNLMFVWLFGSSQGISQYALEYLVAIHFVIAAFGAYLVIKTMGASKRSSFLAGLIFAFSGVVAFRAISQTNIFFGLCLIPYPLFFLLKYHNDDNSSKRWLLYSGLVLGLIILSGHVDPFFFALVILGILEASLIKRDWQSLGKAYGQVRGALKRLLIILGVTALIALPQLLVSAKYLQHAYRIQADGYTGPGEKIDYGAFSKAFNIDPHEVANLIEPDRYPIRDGNNIFMGLVPLAVIILGLIFAHEQIKKRLMWTRYSDFILALLIFGAVAMMGYWTWFAVLLYELPLVYQIRQLARYAILFQLALTFGLALALDEVADIHLTKRHRIIIGLTGLFLLINSLYLFLLRLHIFNTHYALQVFLLSIFLLLTVVNLRHNVKTAAIGMLIVLTAALNTRWFLPKIKTDTKTPTIYHLPADLVSVLTSTNGQYRVEVEDEAVPVNIGNVYPVQTIGGYAATMYAPYYEALHKSQINQDFIKDILGVKYTVTRNAQAFAPIVYADNSQHVYVVERSAALPKFFVSLKNGSTVTQDYRPLASITDHYDDRYQKFEVTAPQTEKIIISELQYPGWQLRIDGRLTDWQPYTIGDKQLLRQFNMPAGKHTVEFTYKPFGVL